jgi:hypothetical protein
VAKNEKGLERFNWKWLKKIKWESWYLIKLL